MTLASDTHSPEASGLDHIPTGLLVGGRWRPSADGRTFVVEDPATELPLAEVADAAPTDGLAALAAAATAQTGWAAVAPRERGELLRRSFDALVARTEEFAHLISLEMGKPLREARAEVAYGAEFLRWFAEEAVRVGGRWSTSPDGATRLITMRQPVGPTLMITPWNFPLAMATRKIAPAIAAGCTMLIKPAAQTPLTMLAFGQLLIDCGVPPGVVNIITTTRPQEVVAAVIADSRLRKLTFTGSTPVGRSLVAQSAEQLLRVSMELGGNAPFLVLADADVDAAVEGAIKAKMRNMGEACTAANRFLVHESLADEFSAKLASKMQALVIGPGTDGMTEVGPLIDSTARAKVQELVDDAIQQGARRVVGGSPTEGRGYFYQPTVLVDVPHTTRLLHEEVFGPVAPIVTFSTTEEAVAQANATEFGLVAYVFTRDVSDAIRVSEQLEVGMVGINQGVVSNPAAPFGGIKHSGFGREGGFEGIEEYLEVKYVGIAP